MHKIKFNNFGGNTRRHAHLNAFQMLLPKVKLLRLSLCCNIKLFVQFKLQFKFTTSWNTKIQKLLPKNERKVRNLQCRMTANSKSRRRCNALRSHTHMSAGCLFWLDSPAAQRQWLQMFSANNFNNN